VIFRLGTSTFCPRSLWHPIESFPPGIEKVPTADEWTVVLTCARMVETANATVGCVEHSLLPSSGDVFSTFRVTGWSAKALSVVRIRLFEKFVNSAIQNYGPIMVHEPVPTTTKHAFGSHPRRVFSISYLLTGFFHGGNTGSNPVGDANNPQQLTNCPL
jgi:hypothetical protein